VNAPRLGFLLACSCALASCGVVAPADDDAGAETDAGSRTDSGADAGSVAPVAPTVLATSPDEGASGIEPTSAIEATFSANMAASTLDVATFVVTRDGASVEGTVTYTAASRVATFRPATGLALLGEYTVTLTTEVTDLEGTALAEDYTWSFTIRDGTWGTAELLENDDAGHAGFPKVVFDESGNATAAWAQSDGTRTSIWANRYVPELGWGTATLLETEDGPNAANVEIAVDPSGVVTAVWVSWDVWSNRYVPGEGWGTATIIGPGADGAPYVAVDPSGNATAVWYQTDGTRYNVWANRYVAGTGWGSATLLENDNAGDAFDVRVAVDPMGNATVIWDQYDGSYQSLWATRFQPGFGWALPARIETGTGNVRDSQLAVDASGHAIAVWHQHNGTRFDVWSNRYEPGVGWGEAVRIEMRDDPNALGVQLAVSSAGDAIAVWFGYPFCIWANRFDPDTGWGEPIEIDTASTGELVFPQIAMDRDGNAIAIWAQTDGTRNNIWARRLVGSEWAPPVLVETDNVGDAREPQLGIDARGNAVAVWFQYDGAERGNVWANSFR
jgi:hypothetical protein